MSHHQYSRNPDHIRRRNVPAPDNAAIDNHLKELLGTSVYSQQAYYRRLGMRDRILTLPLMVAAVVTLLWHQVPSVNELTRMLNRKDLLWATSTKVSRQALSERFLSFPYALFEGVFHTLVPRVKAQWAQRSRPLPPSVAYGMKHFEQIWATWLMYAVLVDLSDAVADAVQLPLERISMEMVWRGLYHFNHASVLVKQPTLLTIWLHLKTETSEWSRLSVNPRKTLTLDLIFMPFPAPLDKTPQRLTCHPSRYL